jgi:ribosomal protein L32
LRYGTSLTKDFLKLEEIKRRTHYKAATLQIATCPTTGEAHLYHRAHWSEGKLYYKGKVVMEKEATV